MKRVLTFLALMLLPLSVMAMTPVSDSTLSDVTGQSGVNINADVTMDIKIGTLAWGDRDGIGSMATIPTWGGLANATGGYVGVNNLNIQNLHIRARTESSDTGSAHFAYSSATSLKPITIDVITGTSAAVAHGVDVTFVRFGLGSLQVSMNALSLQVALGHFEDPVALTQVLGIASIGALDVYIHPVSYVDIYTAAGMGVNMDMYVVLDQVKLSYVSWGDTDGLNNTQNIGTANMWFGVNSQGYVGITNINFGEVIIDGTVRIDVASTLTGGAGIYSAHPASIVHIGLLDGFDIKVNGPITFNVRTANNPQLDLVSVSGLHVNELGNVYMSGLEVQFKNNSWIDIWAH